MVNLDDATRARLGALVNGEAPYTLGPYRDDLRALLAAYDALLAEQAQAQFLAQSNADTANLNRQEIERLEAEQAQAAPVLEELERLATCPYSDVRGTEAILAVYRAWRAAREG